MTYEKPQDGKISSKENRKVELDKIMGKATDMELVNFLSSHINEPCEVEVSPGEIKNIRQYYLEFARSVLDKLTNPFAREILEKKIKEHEKD